MSGRGGQRRRRRESEADALARRAAEAAEFGPLGDERDLVDPDDERQEPDERDAAWTGDQAKLDRLMAGSPLLDVDASDYGRPETGRWPS